MRLIDADALMEYCSNQKSKTISNNDIARFPTIEPSGELISRQDAIEAVVCHIWHTPYETRKLFNCENYVRDVVEDAINRLPSADRPKAEPSDLISRADAIEVVKSTKPIVRSTERNWGKMIAEEHSRALCRALKALPSADRPKGEWEQAKYVWECSNCGYMTETPTHYCPSCGTRMAIPTTEHKEEDNSY